jgi:hypothetical protein
MIAAPPKAVAPFSSAFFPKETSWSTGLAGHSDPQIPTVGKTKETSPRPEKNKLRVGCSPSPPPCCPSPTPPSPPPSWTRAGSLPPPPPPPPRRSCGSSGCGPQPAASTWGRGPPPLCLTAGRLLLRAGLGLRKVGASTVGTLGHGVSCTSGPSRHHTLHRASMSLVSCCSGAPPASRIGSVALGLDVAPPTAVATPHVRPDLLVGLGVVAASLKTQPSSSDRSVYRLVRNREDHRRCRDDLVVVPSLDARSAAQPSDGEGIFTPSFSASSSSRSESVPCDPLPRYRATGIACTFTHHQAVLASRPVTLGSADRAARITSSRCPAAARRCWWPSCGAPVLPTPGEEEVLDSCIRSDLWSSLLMAAWTLAVLLAKSSLVPLLPIWRAAIGLAGSRSIAAPGSSSYQKYSPLGRGAACPGAGRKSQPPP